MNESEIAAAALSPLAEADARSLDELFSREPVSWSQADLELMVAAFRRQRLLWEAGEKVPKKNKSSPNPALSAQIKLEELDIQV